MGWNSTFQFSFFLGGVLVDKVFEPAMVWLGDKQWIAFLFGKGKGSGAAVMMFVIGLLGAIVCLSFSKLLKKYRFENYNNG